MDVINDTERDMDTDARPILYGVADYAEIRKANAWFVDGRMWNVPGPNGLGGGMENFGGGGRASGDYARVTCKPTRTVSPGCI